MIELICEKCSYLMDYEMIEHTNYAKFHCKRCNISVVSPNLLRENTLGENCK